MTPIARSRRPAQDTNVLRQVFTMISTPDNSVLYKTRKIPPARNTAPASIKNRNGLMPLPPENLLYYPVWSSTRAEALEYLTPCSAFQRLYQKLRIRQQ